MIYNKHEIINIPEEIPRGVSGWKVRRLERQLLDIMSRATTPQHGWHIYQKIKRYIPSPPNGDEIAMRIASLRERGYLIRVGEDLDCGYTYQLRDKHEQ